MTHQIANCLKKFITAKAVIMIKVKNYISFLREKDSYTMLMYMSTFNAQSLEQVSGKSDNF